MEFLLLKNVYCSLSTTLEEYHAKITEIWHFANNFLWHFFPFRNACTNVSNVLVVMLNLLVISSNVFTTEKFANRNILVCVLSAAGNEKKKWLTKRLQPSLAHTQMQTYRSTYAAKRCKLKLKWYLWPVYRNNRHRHSQMCDTILCENVLKQIYAPPHKYTTFSAKICALIVICIHLVCLHRWHQHYYSFTWTLYCSLFHLWEISHVCAASAPTTHTPHTYTLTHTVKWTKWYESLSHTSNKSTSICSVKMMK